MGGTEDTSLVDALDDARRVLDGLRLPLDVSEAAGARLERAALVAELDDYVLPRARTMDAPLLAVVGGSTGAGKSTLVNSLLRQVVTPAGVLRPTTLAPVLVHHPADAWRFVSDAILPGLDRVRADEPVPAARSHTSLRLAPSEVLPQGLALLDAPDVDSVVDENRRLAGQLLAAADLWLFVTTAARYADAVPWALLSAAARRRARVALVLNRVDPGTEDTISSHLRQMLAERGLPETPVFTVTEGSTTYGLLDVAAVAELSAWLAATGADPSARARIIAGTLDGAVDDVVARTAALAQAAEAQVTARARLDGAVDAAYGAAAADIVSATADGVLLRGEVLARWQDFVGTGELFRKIEAGVGRFRDRVSGYFRGQGSTTAPDVTEAVGHSLEAVILDAVHGAAERTYAAWRADPAGTALADGLGRGATGLREEVGAEIRAWQGDVLALVAEGGAHKRGRARALSFGVNGLGAALMIVVFASTGGLTGAEIGIAGGSAVLAQRLLEAVFGDEAVRQLTADARTRLAVRVQGVLDGDARRFRARLADVAPDVGAPAALRTTAADLRSAAQRSRAMRPVPLPEAGPATSLVPSSGDEAAGNERPAAERRRWWRPRGRS